MTTLVVIPTYNERSNISQLVPQLLNLDGNLRVLVVDDNSPDGTGQVVAALGKADERVSLLQRPGKMGLGSAYVEGFRHALDMKPDRVVQMDADFSHNPAMVPKLVEESTRADVVIGSRYLNGVNVVNWPLGRLLLSYTANIYARAVTRVPVCDLTGGFKCFTREALESVPLDRIASDGYAFQIETTFWCYRNGFTIAEIPIVFEDRHSGTSKMTKEIVREAFWLVLRLGIFNLTHRRRSAPHRPPPQR